MYGELWKIFVIHIALFKQLILQVQRDFGGLYEKKKYRIICNYY